MSSWIEVARVFPAKAVILFVLLDFWSLASSEKIQLSAPDKKSTLVEPEPAAPKKRRTSNPFELLDRQNSTGGAIEVPGVAPAAPGGAKPDPRIEKRLRDVLERERLRENGYDPDSERRRDSNRDDRDRDSDAGSDSSERETGIEYFDRQERIRRALTGKDEDMSSEEDATDGKRSRNSKNGEREIGDRSGKNSKPGSRTTYNPASKRPDASRTESNGHSDSTASFGAEPLQISDPFTPTKEGDFPASGFGASIRGTESRPTAAQVETERQRSEQFKQLLTGKDSSATAASGGSAIAPREDFGYGRTPSERAERFRSLMRGTTPGTDGSKDALGIVKSGPALPTPSTSFLPTLSPSTLGAPSSGALPFFTPPAPPTALPTSAPHQPVRLQLPGRGF